MFGNGAQKSAAIAGERPAISGGELDRHLRDRLEERRTPRIVTSPASGTIPITSRLASSEVTVRGTSPAPCPLTPNEQYSFMSLWCLMASPLVLQRRHGQARRVHVERPLQSGSHRGRSGPARPMRPRRRSSLAVRSCLRQRPGRRQQGGRPLQSRRNRDATVTAKWTDLGLTGKQRVRDLWRQKDLGQFDDAFSAKSAATARFCSACGRWRNS